MLTSSHKTRRASRHLGTTGVLVVVAAALVLLVGCGAPASRPASGPVSDAIRAALDHGGASFSHDEWHGLLAAGARDGLVDYRYFQQHRDTLETYLQRVAAADLASLAPQHLKALLINGYNALTIQSVLDHPGVASIRDIDGVWTDTLHRVGGFELTLDGIEHTLLRPYFRDPRIHFGVNCASRSCAPLPDWAYDGDRLDEQLDERTRAFLTDPQHVKLTGTELEVSRYFEWYGGDFVAEGWAPRADSTALFIAAFTDASLATAIRSGGDRLDVRFLDYNWDLNASTAPDPSVSGPVPSTPATDSGFVARLRDTITGWGPLGAVAYIVAYALLTTVFVPASPLTLGAGAAYGVVWGTALVSVGSVGGAALAFLVARYLLRARVARWMAGDARFAAIDKAVGTSGWKIVGLTRLSPIFPFNLLNYAFGLTAVGFWPYILISWIAMLPGTVLYVYIGAAGADVTAAVTGSADWGGLALKGVGLLGTLAVTVIVTRIARSALREAAAVETS